MRDKKVRAWDKVTEKYLYSETFPSMWQFYRELENRGIRHFETGDCTGLLDKKGKEIYEGDITRRYWDNGSMQDGQIIFQDAQFLWQEIKGGINFIHPIGINTLHSEVIGNIYENEDLLK